MLNIILFTLLLVSSSWAHEYLETKTHIDVFNKASELRFKYGGKNVLVVFDIDNTLLKANQSLGSDQWFEWQAEAIKLSSIEASFKTFNELLKAQADFFSIRFYVTNGKKSPSNSQRFKEVWASYDFINFPRARLKKCYRA